MDEIEKLETAKAELSEIIREARGAIKDARTERRLLIEQKVELRKMVKTKLKEAIEEEVAKGLESYQNELGRQVDLTQKALDKRFDNIMNILLGEDWESKKEGKRPIVQMLKNAPNVVDYYIANEMEPE